MGVIMVVTPQKQSKWLLKVHKFLLTFLGMFDVFKNIIFIIKNQCRKYMRYAYKNGVF